MASKGRRGVNVARNLETGAILGALTVTLAVTGLLLSPSVSAVIGYSALAAGGGNVVYAIHIASAALLVAFTLWHVWPIAHALARKAGVSAAAQGNSYALLALITVEIVTGVVLWFHGYRVLPKSLAVHAHLYATFLVLAPLSWHAWRGTRTWLKRRAAAGAALAAAETRGKGEQARAAQAAVSRRAFLRVGAYATLGVALAWAFGRFVSGEIAGWRLNYVGNTPALAKESYRLRVTGLVENPIDISYDELVAMGVETRRFTHRCVEGWTYTDDFAGVPLQRVLERAGGAKAGAAMLIFKSPEVSTTPQTRGQTYSTNFPFDARALDRHLVVVRAGGEELPAIHGGPVRLMSPAKWGYKACKWLTEIEVSADASYRGYWERLGYNNVGDYPGPIFG